MKKLSCLILAMSMLLSACGGSSGHGGGKAVVPFEKSAQAEEFIGLWLEKADALELRNTGGIPSVCAEIKKDPGYEIANVRKINEKGELYIYNPAYGEAEFNRVGQLDGNGHVTLTSKFSKMAGATEFNVAVKGDVLDFQGVLTFLRSNEAEVSKYYELQKECPK